jgi:hypothetical protein
MSTYVKWLCSHVGNRKIILVRACGIVADERARVLLRRHPDLGWWGLPGSRAFHRIRIHDGLAGEEAAFFQ